ncbi:MAG: SDR family NAD(P)-dependent oxidoreductase [Rhodospirillales bacterium]|nr:SDR family NAD(P)-dependent oxidoreductase [Rhodospirillales bacterium]
MRLEGKTALITGGSSGIGEAIALRFAAEGARIAVAGNANLAKAQGVADRIEAAGGQAQAFVADVRDVSAVKLLVADVKAAFGRIDILVNSAGIFEPTPIGETAEAEYDATMDINVKGTFFAINEVAPVMIAQGGGKIVNLSSVTGVMGFKTFSVYCASKAAINYLTRALALELSPHNIAVNAILPGNTATPMNVKIRTEPEFKEMLDGMAAVTPSTRTYSDADDMASAALFLCSDDGRAAHGSLMLLDEGISCGL